MPSGKVLDSKYFQFCKILHFHTVKISNVGFRLAVVERAAVGGSLQDVLEGLRAVGDHSAIEAFGHYALNLTF